MSRFQLLVVLISSLSSFVLVILAWLHSNARLTDAVASMNRNFDRMDKRFEAIDRKFEGIEKRLDRIDGDLKEFYGTTKRLEGRVDEISRR